MRMHYLNDCFLVCRSRPRVLREVVIINNSSTARADSHSPLILCWARSQPAVLSSGLQPHPWVWDPSFLLCLRLAQTATPSHWVSGLPSHPRWQGMCWLLIEHGKL